MQTKHEVPNTKVKILLAVPEQETKKVILFVPGISGGAFSDRFAPLVAAALGAGFAIARFSSWEGEEEVGVKTIDEILHDIDAAVQYLLDTGYTSVMAVGKSLGGGMLLANQNQNILSKVVWAPAIGIAERGTITELREQKIAVLRSSLLSVTLDRTYVGGYHGLVCLIHGTADNAIPFKNSQKLHEAIPNSILVSIEGADHSYRNPEHERELIAHTISFLVEKSK